MDKNVKSALTIMGIILLGIILWTVRFVIAYVMVAAVISLIGKPIVQKLNTLSFRKKKMPRAVSALVALLFIYLIVFSVMSLILPILAGQADTLSRMDTAMFLEKFDQPISDFENYLINHNYVASQGELQELVSEKFLSIMSFTRISTAFNFIVTFAGNIFIAFFTITFVSFFFLKDDKMFVRGVLMITPDPYQNEIRSILSKTRRLLTRYFIGLTLDITLVSTLFTIGLTLLGVENALFIGVFAGIMNIVPYLGSIIGASLGILLGLASMPGADFYHDILPMALPMLGIFVTVNLTDGFVFQPLIYASSVKAHPLEIFLVIMVSATLAGIPGMVLAIPAYSFFRIIGKEFLTKSKIIQNITRNI
ncbi:MAG: AI-2E family transporter [Bacteroidetes bacterium]|nr:AI-2E family transporter [Bacteroidota bacterium]